MENLFLGLTVVVLVAASTGSRCTEADKIECGVNEKTIEGGCVCEKGYIRSYTGECDQCDQGYLQSNDETGKLVCTPAKGDNRALSKDFRKNDQTVDSQMSSTYDRKRDTYMFRDMSIFDDSTVKSAMQFEKEGNNVPGVYPSIHYKQVPFISTEEFEAESLRAANAVKQRKPFLNRTHVLSTGVQLHDRMANVRYSKAEGESGIHDLPFDMYSGSLPLPTIPSSFKAHEFDENPGPYPSIHYKQVEYAAKQNVKNGDKFKKKKQTDRTSVGELPEPQYLEKTNIAVGNVAADYAMGSFGLNFSNPHGQLTSFANGDVMTGYKPINEVVRPISVPVLTNRIEERENTYTPTANDVVLQPPIPIEELNKKRKNGEELGRIPYGTTGSLVPPKVTGKLPERDVGDALKVWTVGNPYYEITGKYNSRRETEFRNKRQVHIPDTMGQGFYGNYLNPLNDVTNHDRLNQAGVDGIQDERHNERILAEPRPAFADIDTNLVRSVPNRATSNKTNHDHESEFYLYENRNSTAQPVRGSQITIDNMRFDFGSYSQLPMNIPQFESRDSVAMGLPALN